MSKTTRNLVISVLMMVCWVSFDLQTIYCKGYDQVVTNEVTPSSKSSAGSWIQGSNGRWWYRHSDGSYTTNGWEKIDGDWYYFDFSGWMVTGFLVYNSFTYYCDPSTGAMVTGWKQIDDDWYFFQTNDDYNLKGRMIKGEVNLNGVGYYLDDTSGIMVTNEWKKLKSINSGRNRYGFYASSGYLKNDSDIEGCYEGYSVFSHGVFSRPIETVVYYINTPANTSVDHSKVRIEIKKALERCARQKSYNPRFVLLE